MFSRSVSAIVAKNPNRRRPEPLGSYIPWRGPAGISRTRSWSVRRCQLGGVVSEALHLVDVEDHSAVRGVSLDLPGGGEGCLEMGADPNPGADLLREDLVPGDVLGGERVELCPEFVGEGRAARVSDADVRAGGVRGDGRRRRGAGVPGRPGCRGPRSAGVGTRRSFASRGTLVKRPVW